MGKPLARRKVDRTQCPQLMHEGGPIMNPVPVHVTADGKRAARLGDFAVCMTPLVDVIFEGAATVTACRLPLARRGDHTAHGGRVSIGSPTVRVGGPTFHLPPNITVRGPANFKNLVIRDLYFLSTTPTGRTTLRQLHVTGKKVVIEPGSDPHNSSATPNDRKDARNGSGTGAYIHYNPNISVWVEDAARKRISMTPQVVLAHELIHALHFALGVHGTDDDDPVTPASNRKIDLEESKTIGTGTFSGTSPTENSLRRDLGLPRRDNHQGFNGTPGKPTANSRPGDC